MELRHLRYFVAVAEEENITRAAARLRVSQPPLSRQIRDLEEELGVPLFEHGTRSIRLTGAGAEFLTEARSILKQVDRAVSSLVARYAGGKGGIHVGYAPSLAAKLLPGTLRLFESRLPGVRVHLHDMTTEEMLEGLQEGRLNLALVIRNKVRPSKKLTFEVLEKFAVGVAVGPDHRLAALPKVSLRELGEERLIAYSQAGYPEYHTWLGDLFRKVNPKPRVCEEYDGFPSMIAALEAGRGVALVQDGFGEVAAGRVKIRLLDPPPPPFLLAVAYRKDADCPMTRTFIEAARELVAKRAQSE